jgi:hypothetical protein
MIERLHTLYTRATQSVTKARAQYWKNCVAVAMRYWVVRRNLSLHDDPSRGNPGKGQGEIGVHLIF